MRYYHGDRTSVRMIMDESGKVVGTQDQEPYGEMVSESGERIDRKFTSYIRDNETGMDYAVNRDYQTSIGRYGQPDRIQGSIRNPQTLNRYAYTTNDPINLVDPLGLEGIENDYGIVPVYGGGTGWGGIVGNYMPKYLPIMYMGDEGMGGGLDPVLQKTIDKAKQALQKEQCRKLFSDSFDPIQLLTNLASGDTGLGSIAFGDLGSPKNGSVKVAHTIGILGSKLVANPNGNTVKQSIFTGADIVINNNSAAPWQNGFGGFLGISDSVNRAVTIIHELGHAARRIYGANASQIYDDDDAKINKANSQRVYDNCFK